MYMVDSCDIDVERAEGWERECVEERKMQVRIRTMHIQNISLVPRRSRGRRESVWYTLFAHAFNFPGICENSILQ